MADVMIDGVWAMSFGHVSDVKWSTRYGDGPCGPDLASFTIDLDPSNDSSSVRLGRKVEIFAHGVKKFGGVISEMGRGTPREISAKGWARAHDRTSNYDGDRWGYDAENVAFTPTDPTTPTWFLDASDLDIGVADDGLYTRVIATYISAYTAGPPEQTTLSTVAVDDSAAQDLYGVITYGMDLQSLGVISSSAATSYANTQLKEFTVPQWLSRVTTNSQRLRTAGGHGARLTSVAAGQMVRLFNVPNNLGGIRNELGLDVILGEVEYDTSNPLEVSIAPVGLAVRNIADLAAAGSNWSAA